MDKCLYRETVRLALRAKTFSVLEYLVEHPGRLVTTTELLDTVWLGTRVVPVVVRGCIRELRRVLADDPKAPKYIETVQGQGYRFIAPVTETAGPGNGAGTFVGRDTECAQLHGWLAQAVQGQRQLVFVTGEAGIGKTRLIDAFLEQVAADRSIWIGRGQCVESYGIGEAYRPVLKALGRLDQTTSGKRLSTLLARYAPTWLVQLPHLLKPSDQDTLHRQVQGATPERMLRELAEALEALTAKQPLVLVLEDLHWSDYSTVDLLATLARRQERARLLLIGTFRPAEVLDTDHPLQAIQQELSIHGQCHELGLTGLTVEAVQTYLAIRLPGQGHRDTLRVLHERTEGNPLFLISLVNELLRQGDLPLIQGQDALRAKLTRLGVPRSIQPLFAKQFSRLTPDEQALLEVASVVGMEFSAATVAAVLETDVPQVECLCEALGRRALFLQPNGVHPGPEQRQASRYRFLHALSRSTLHEHLGIAQRRQLHQRIGLWKEQDYGARAKDCAAELAVHFEWGQDYPRAIQYREQAADNSLQRSASQEAIDHLRKGLALLDRLPETPERRHTELTFQLALGIPLIATKGYADLAVKKTYERARTLCRQVGDTAQRRRALAGLCEYYLVLAEFQTALALGKELLRLAHQERNTDFVLSAHTLLGATEYFLGNATACHKHYAQGIKLYDRARHNPTVSGTVQDPGVYCLGGLGVIDWYLGFPDRAVQHVHQALCLAEELAHPHNSAFAVSFAAEVYVLRREGAVAHDHAAALITLAQTHGFSFWEAEGMAFLGGALVEQGQPEQGALQLQQGLAACRATGAHIDETRFLGLLADAYRQAGQFDNSAAALAEAFASVEQRGERYYAAELYRLRGEILLVQEVKSPSSFTPHCSTRAEECFRQAVAIARRQQAKSLELRAVMSLSRLWQRQGKTAKAKKRLATIYGQFTEGFDTKDLQEARELLEALS